MPTVAQECSLIGLFPNADAAQRAREDLIRAGFSQDEVYIRAHSETAQAETTGGGGFWDSIKDLFGARDTNAYEEASRRGNYIVAVNTIEEPQMIDRAAEILKLHNPIDFDESCEPVTSSAAPAAGEARTSGLEEEEGRIPVVEEQMKVGKRRELAGGVRLYSRVTEQPVEEDVTLRDERVRVERRPADRPAGPEAFREGEVEAVETREVPVVSKEARVVEEVVVEKGAEQRRETVRDKVRRQDVGVERLDEGQAGSADRPAGQQP